MSVCSMHNPAGIPQGFVEAQMLSILKEKMQHGEPVGAALTCTLGLCCAKCVVDIRQAAVLHNTITSQSRAPVRPVSA